MPNEPVDGLLNYEFMKCNKHGSSCEDEFYCAIHERLIQREKKKELKLKEEQKKKELKEELKNKTVVLCGAIIKSGARKGESCTAKSTCKRHAEKKIT